MKKYRLLFLLLILVSNELISQQWNQTTFTVLRAPELGNTNFGNIIISEIVNYRNRPDEHTRDIYDELANRITQINGLTLIDRDKTQKLLAEFEFQQSSGLVNSDQIRKLGEFLGSGVIVFARIQRDQYNDEVISESMFAEINGCKTRRYRKGTYDLYLNFKMINLQTAEVIYSRNLNSSLYLTTSKYQCKTPPRIDKNDIYPQNVKDIGKKFQNLFVEYEQDYRVTFQKHSKINDRLKQAITYFNINEFDEGLEIISSIPPAQKNDKAKSAALYNLSLVQYYSSNYSESLKNAKRAYILDPKNSDCLTIINWME